MMMFIEVPIGESESFLCQYRESDLLLGYPQFLYMDEKREVEIWAVRVEDKDDKEYETLFGYRIITHHDDKRLRFF